LPAPGVVRLAGEGTHYQPSSFERVRDGFRCLFQSALADSPSEESADIAEQALVRVGIVAGEPDCLLRIAKTCPEQSAVGPTEVVIGLVTRFLRGQGLSDAKQGSRAIGLIQCKERRRIMDVMDP
jgi:hypothetical protein